MVKKELYTKQQALELLEYYNNGDRVSLIAKSGSDKDLPTISVIESNLLNTVVDTLHYTVLFTYQDYVDFIDGRLIISTSKITNFIHKEVNRRLSKEFKGVLTSNKQGGTNLGNNWDVSFEDEVIEDTLLDDDEVNTKYVLDEAYAFTMSNGKVLYRIKALRDIELITGEVILEGSYGGYIEAYHNLSIKGNCWVKDDAQVYGKAQVLDDAVISGQSIIKHSASIKGQVQVRDQVIISEDAQVMGRSIIKGHAQVKGKAQIGNAVVIYDRAVIEGSAKIGRYTQIGGDVVVKGNALLVGDKHYNQSEVIM